VVDILPPEKPTPSIQQPKKPGKGVFKNMFKKKSSESSSVADSDSFEPDTVEEMFEDGSAMLSQRFVMKNLILLSYEWMLLTSVLLSIRIAWFCCFYFTE